MLGHKIDHRGIHADSDKMTRIRNFPRPRNLVEVQRFLGLATYLAMFLPTLATFTTVLSAIKAARPFVWLPIHDAAFNRIKELTCRKVILKPIRADNPEQVWLITDASLVGLGAYYGQGPTWEECRPAGFLSKKLTGLSETRSTSQGMTGKSSMRGICSGSQYDQTVS